jgi:hypothetical protein
MQDTDWSSLRINIHHGEGKEWAELRQKGKVDLLSPTESFVARVWGSVLYTHTVTLYWVQASFGSAGPWVRGTH